MLGHVQISQLQLLQDEQQAQHQRQKRLLEEELVRLRQVLQQSNRNLELSRNGAEVWSTGKSLYCTIYSARSAWIRQMH